MATLIPKYDQGATSAVNRPINEKLGEIISVKDFGAVGNGITDDTAAIQAALDASKNKRLFINAGTYKTSSTLNLDTNYNYYIYGEGKSEYATPCSTIYNAGTGNTITINNTGTSNDNQYTITDLNINSSSSSTQNGIYIYNAHGVILNSVWITNHGLNGISMEKSWGFRATDCIFAQNYHSGVYAKSQNNAVTFLRCTFNGNARLDGGYAGVFLTAASAGYENLAVNLIGCDLSGNGYPADVIAGLGLVAQYSFGINIIGTYMENNKSANIYVDNTVKNIAFTGNYFQDGLIGIVQPKSLVYQNNHHAISSLTTYAVQISGYTDQRYQNTVQNNTYDTNVTTLFTTGVKEINQTYDSTAPSAGTWKVGDIVWTLTPVSAGYVGWICTVAGTPGTWKTFGLIS